MLLDPSEKQMMQSFGSRYAGMKDAIVTKLQYITSEDPPKSKSFEQKYYFLG